MTHKQLAVTQHETEGICEKEGGKTRQVRTLPGAFGPLQCLPKISKFLFVKWDSNQPLPVFGASISKVLIKNIQNTILDFDIFLFLLCSAWQMCLCTHSVCFHASSADTNMQHIVPAFMLTPIYRFLSVLPLPCLKALTKWGQGMAGISLNSQNGKIHA